MELSKIKLSELEFEIKKIETKLSITELIDQEILHEINSKYFHLPVYFNFQNISVVQNFEYLNNLKDITLFVPYGVSFKELDFLENFHNLKSLHITSLERNKISFKKIEHLNNLEVLEFNGFDNKSQYKFVNLQTNLKRLHLKRIDLNLIERNEELEELTIQSTIKSENEIGVKFPNLKNLNLHACSGITDHSFISQLNSLEDITINYNSHITHFPKINNPKLLKRVVMLTCSNYCDIDTLLSFENIETFCLTSYDKPLQLSINEFEKLKKLKKLKRVYTEFGRRSKEDLKQIERVYAETKWINNML